MPVLLVSCMRVRCLSRVEGTQFECFEDRDARTRVEDSEQFSDPVEGKCP